MTAELQQIFDILKDRGLELKIGSDGPRICGPKEEITPSLIETLKEYRDEIIAHLKSARDEHEDRVEEVLPLIGFPPDQFVSAGYSEWLRKEAK